MGSLDSVCHLFVGYHFSKEVWAACLTLKGAGKWGGGSLSSAIKGWYEDKDVSKYKAFLIAVSWVIWCSRNEIIFQSLYYTLEQVFYRVQFCYEECKEAVRESSQGQIEQW